MSGEDFIKLPNGKQINLKGAYGKVDIEAMPKRSVLRAIFNCFDTIGGNNKLNSSEISNIFNSLKNYAAQDGNDELSSAELFGFIKEHCPEENYGKITPKDMLKFFDILQKESGKSLKAAEGKSVHIENTLNKVFPELGFLNLGADNNIDTTKFSLEGIKKLYPEDKYTVQEKTETQYITDYGDGRMSVSNYEMPISPDAQSYTREITKIEIRNKETGKEVVTGSYYNDNTLEIKLFEEESGKEFQIIKHKNDNVQINSNSTTVSIDNNKINYIMDGEDFYTFDDGVLEKIETKNTVTTFKDGILDKVEEKKYEAEEVHEDISEKLTNLLNEDNINTDEISNLINNSVQSKSIGQDMDDYFAKTGRELTDDIKTSKLPEDVKNKLLNSINEPFVNSSYYDADKKVESSKINNKYYTSEDEYSVQYNGAIINVLNKTTGEITRINLKTLMKDLEFDSSKRMKKSLQNIQNYPGEVLENLGIEISSVRTLTKEQCYSETNKLITAAFYSVDVITTPGFHGRKGGTVVHEISHGIDDVSGTENPGYKSASGKFKEVFDKCIERYEAQGHKRFDDQHPNRGNTWWNVMARGTNYATYNEQEAFAICMQILMGYEDDNTKFVRKCMPELIDAAKELYQEIRRIPREERRYRF